MFERARKINIFSPISSIILIAFLVRMVVIITITPPLWQDSKDYVEIARSLTDHQSFSVNGTITAYRAPGYPFFLAGIFTFLHDSLAIVRIIQMFFGILSSLLVYAVGKELGSERTAQIAALLYSVVPDSVLYVSLIMTETVFTTLFLAAILGTLRLRRSPTLNNMILLGIVFGLMSIVRQNGIVLLLIVLGWDLFFTRSMKITVKRYSIVLFVFLLIQSPWMVRNKVHFDRFALTSNGGVNFWIGNNAGASGTFKYDPETNPLEKITGEFERSDKGFQLGMEFIEAHPTEEIKLLALKMVHLFEPDFALLQSIYYRPEWRSYSRAKLIYREFPPIIFIIIHGISATILLGGLWLLFFTNWMDYPGMQLISVAIAGWLLSHLVFFGAARFRLPIMPLMMILFAQSIDVVRHRMYRLSPVRMASFGTIFLALTGSWIAMFVLIYLE
jgi:4-amino-4-deoxy-L-arabinose transferase-like glycosyltransferase